MGRALVRSVRAIADELRSAWASGRRVSLTIAGDETRVEGHVLHISSTDGATIIAGLLVPLDRVLAVYWPTRLGDSDFIEGRRWCGRRPIAARRDPAQMELFV